MIQAAIKKDLASIQYPTDGTLIALDPDIPPHYQRLPLLLTAPAKPGWQWQMDNQSLGQAVSNVFWLPQPGHHRLSLVDEKGKENDMVEFEVKAPRGKVPGR